MRRRNTFRWICKMLNCSKMFPTLILELNVLSLCWINTGEIPKQFGRIIHRYCFSHLCLQIKNKNTNDAMLTNDVQSNMRAVVFNQIWKECLLISLKKIKRVSFIILNLPAQVCPWAYRYWWWHAFYNEKLFGRRL